jgi:glutathione S-transferase
MKPILYIGNKNYSSWSLRPWLALRWANIAFEERVILLDKPGYGRSKIADVLAVSPSGRVPALTLGDLTIWDSLAICEWAAEQPQARLWPDDARVRAVCRSVVCEMHSSFAAVRRDMAMNIRRRTSPRAWPEDTRDDLVRIEELWSSMRARYGASGPFLFGERTVADAFFAPVVTRFRSYGVPLSKTAAAYSEAVLSDAAFQEWEQSATHEQASIGATDAL